jgi:hypothetical protein
MLVRNAQKLCGALALGMTMAIASQTSALAFGSYNERKEKTVEAKSPRKQNSHLCDRNSCLR